MLSGSKFVVWAISSDLCPSDLVNRLMGLKQVILVALRDGWVEQYPLGVCSLLQIIQLLNIIQF